MSTPEIPPKSNQATQPNNSPTDPGRHLYISLDIGGTSSRGVAVNWPGGPCVRLEAPSKNLRMMVDLELGQLLHNLASMLPESTFKGPSTWLIGGAGARPEIDVNRISQLTSDIGLSVKHLEVFPDFEGNWAAAFGGDDGIVSINGTGSVIFGRWKNHETRRGGWGFLLDEAPSGANFGKWALQEILFEWENQGVPSHFSELYEKIFPEHPQSRQALLGMLYSTAFPQKFLGRFSPVFVEAFQLEHPATRKTLANSLGVWRKQMKEIATELGIPSPVPFSGSGGLWSHWKDFQELAGKSLLEAYPGEFVFRAAEFPPEWGPLMRHLSRQSPDRKSWIGTLRELSRTVIPKAS